MADRYSSLVAVELDTPCEDVELIVKAAGQVGDVDRAAPVRGAPQEAMEVHWGGRMQKAVVRALVDDDGTPLLRTETYLGADGLRDGMQRQAQLLRGLARQLRSSAVGIRDLSAMAQRDLAWMNRVAIGHVDVEDAIEVRAEGEGTWWVRTHGAARFDVPDLELYGLGRHQVERAEALLRRVHGRLLTEGLTADLALVGGGPELYLVPVLEAWQQLDPQWPGVGRGGEERGPGLDGPRATLSILHPPRFGRYRKDFAGVVDAL